MDESKRHMQLVTEYQFDNDKPNYYSVLPASVRYDIRLTDSEKVMYSEIVALSNKYGRCWATNTYFSNLYGTSTRTIVRRIGRLVDLGYIKRDIIYADDSNKVELRYLSINELLPFVTGQDKNDTTLVTKLSPPPSDKFVLDNSKEKDSSLINNIKENSREACVLFVEHINTKLFRKYRTNDKFRKQYNARIKDGFRPEDFLIAFENAYMDDYHRETKHKYLTPIFFTRPDILDKWLNAPKKGGFL